MNIPQIQTELFRQLVGMEPLLKPGYAFNITRNCFKELHANLWKICRDGDGDIGAHTIQNLCVRQITTPNQITAEINRIWQAIPAECKRITLDKS